MTLSFLVGRKEVFWPRLFLVSDISGGCYCHLSISVVVSELEPIRVVFISQVILPLSRLDHIYLQTWGCARMKMMGGGWGRRKVRPATG